MQRPRAICGGVTRDGPLDRLTRQDDRLESRLQRGRPPGAVPGVVGQVDAGQVALTVEFAVDLPERALPYSSMRVGGASALLMTTRLHQASALFDQRPRRPTDRQRIGMGLNHGKNLNVGSGKYYRLPKDEATVTYRRRRRGPASSVTGVLYCVDGQLMCQGRQVLRLLRFHNGKLHHDDAREIIDAALIAAARTVDK